MSDMLEAPKTDHINLTADLVSAYLANNHVAPADVPNLIANVHAALAGLSGAATQNEAVKKLTPAEIKKSITRDHLISFEDGKPYKTLRRHLTLRGLSPEAYREKWGLPSDYPMTSAGYSAQRSDLARALGLGQQRRQDTASSDTAAGETAAPAKPRRRRKAEERAEA